MDEHTDRENDAIRIVSLNPCTDAILARIAPDKLAAVSHYSHDPAASSMDVAEARRWPASAGTVEEIVALEPDLVVASTFLAPSTAQALARLDIPVEQVGIATTVDDSVAQIRALAAAVGEGAAGEALVDEIEAALADAQTDAAPIETIVWQSGGIVPGDGTLIADLLRRTGFANAAAARGLGQADRLPLEAVLADPPALILAAGSPFAEEDRALFHPALDAVEVPHAALRSNLLYCGGPTIIRAVERLKEVRDKMTPHPLAGGAARLGSAQQALVVAGWVENSHQARPTPNPSRRREGS